MEEKITVREWIEKFKTGEYEQPDFDTQVEAGWYDWFCKDSSLAGKTKKMGNIIKGITDPDILDSMYVFFKNNCPMSGPLYDQFKFCDLNNEDVQYCININSVHENARYAVYGQGEWQNPLFEANTSAELKKWFNQGAKRGA